MDRFTAKTTRASSRGFQYVDCSAPGQKVGKYTFIGHLGKGAYSTVYDVVDESGTNHAAKVFRHERRFAACGRTEGALLQDLVDCSHIISCMEMFFLNGAVTLVLDKALTDLYHYQKDFHLQGHSMGCPTDMYSVKDLALSLLQGIKSLEENNVVHCDIKPENVLLKNGADGLQAVLADLGSACQGVRTTTNGLIASPWYRPPEVYAKGLMSHPGDLWSVGCVLFEYAFGDALFDVTRSRHTIAEEVARLFASHVVVMGEPSAGIIDIDGPIVNSLGFPPSFRNTGSLSYEKSDIIILRMRDMVKYTDLHVILSNIFIWDASARVSIADALATVQTWDDASSVPPPAASPPLRK